LRQAYFDEVKNITEHDTLTVYATKLSLDVKRFRKDVESVVSLAAVMANWYEAQKTSISRVPTAIFDKKRAVSGVVSVKRYRQLIDNSLTDSLSQE
jgi:predicted DsbA family dithiol-disulfide isomerase